MNYKRLLLIALNIIIFNLLLSRSNMAWDVTEDQKHSLSPETISLLHKLPSKAKIYFVATEKKQNAQLKPLVTPLKDFLKQLQQASQGKIDYEFIDPNEKQNKLSFIQTHLGVVKQQSQTNDGALNYYFSVVLETGSHLKVYNAQDLSYFDFNANRGSYKLNDLEPLFLRNLFHLSRQYENFRQALAQSRDSQLTLIPIFSKNLAPQAKARADLIARKITDLKRRFPKSFRISKQETTSAETLKIISTRKIKAYSDVNTGLDYFLHMMIQKEDGTLIEVPNLLYMNSVEDIDETLKYHILLTLDKNDKQLGLLTPGLVPALFSGGPRHEDHYALLKRFLKQHYNVRTVDKKLRYGVPTGVSTLMVMGIDVFDQKMTDEIDRFVARGGKLILFADRHKTVLNPHTLYYETQPQDCGLENLLASWGIILHKEIGFAKDTHNMLAMNWPYRRASTGKGNIGLVKIPHPGVPVLKNLPNNILPLQGVHSVTLSYPSHISIQENKEHSISALLPTTGEDKISAFPQGPWISPLIGQGEINKNPFKAEDLKKEIKSPVFGALLKGKFRPVETGDISKLSPETRIAVISDSDFFSSEFYLSRLRDPSNLVKSHLYFNQSFLRNLVDWSFGDDELLKLSSRDIKLRPLDLSKQSRNEGLALVVPLLILLGIGFYSWYRRRA